jgi:hypothetical protein
MRALPLVALFLCGPLLSVVLFGGDTPAHEEGLAAMLPPLAAVLPAAAIWLAARLKLIQVVLFVVFVMVLVLELATGFVPTSQLNHEGTDVLFLFLHVAFFLLSMIVLTGVYGWTKLQAWRRSAA